MLQDTLEAFWAVRVRDPDDAHGLNHLRRVWHNAQCIAETEPGADTLVLLAAAYLHDLVNLPKDSLERASASRLSATKAMPILAQMGLDPGRVTAIAHVIEAHSFSAGIEPRTIEARILQDADRLEALGVIGLARCFYTGGKAGSALWAAEDPFGRKGRDLDDHRYALDHFPLKLLRLDQSMCTREGRRLAEERILVLRDFLDQLARELGELPPSGRANIALEPGCA
jgi:uncharacterized protein